MKSVLLLDCVGLARGLLSPSCHLPIARESHGPLDWPGEDADQ